MSYIDSKFIEAFINELKRDGLSQLFKSNEIRKGALYGQQTVRPRGPLIGRHSGTFFTDMMNLRNMSQKLTPNAPRELGVCDPIYINNFYTTRSIQGINMNIENKFKGVRNYVTRQNGKEFYRLLPRKTGKYLH